MTLDPYATCFCGSGKKIKWCNSKALAEIEKISDLMEKHESENALKRVDRLIVENPEPRCLNMMMRVTRMRALMAAQQPREAFQQLDQCTDDFEEFGLPFMLKGDLMSAGGEIPIAFALYREALSRFPAEALEHRITALLKLADCNMSLNQPLAAWACWQQVLKLRPGEQNAAQSLEKFIGGNRTLPNSVRRGLSLRSPDELAVFNEERRLKWDAALTKEKDWQLQDLKEAFEFLARDDAYDLAAWYNLGLVCAWSGDNALGIDAFSHYVRQETNFEAAADAWDLCEVLRISAFCAEDSDFAVHAAFVEFQEPGRHVSTLQGWDRLVAIQLSKENVLHYVTDRANVRDSAMLIGAKPKPVAQLQVLDDHTIAMRATSAEKLKTARDAVEARLGGAEGVAIEESLAPPDVTLFNLEAFLMPLGGQSDALSAEERSQARAAQFFEEEWINRPLKALDGLTPLDASGSPVAKKKLEGVIRFRERQFGGGQSVYSFDRLRNKLGLTSLIPTDVKAADSPLDVGAFSAAQLASLDPAGLPDERLIVAYRSANSLDVPTTALKLAAEISKRDGLASQIDVIPIFRRLVQDRLENRKPADATTLIDSAIAYDARNYKGEHEGEFESLPARCIAAGGDKAGALKHYRQLFDRFPNDLKIVAAAVEVALREGDFATAKELAQLGVDRAQTTRQRDYQSQFREYLAEATARHR